MLAELPSRLLAVILGLLLVIAVGLGVFAVVHSGTSACTSQHALRDAITTILHTGQKGLPSVAYYKHHPGELHQAQQGYTYALQVLQAVHC